MSEFNDKEIFFQHVRGKCVPVPVAHEGQMALYAETGSMIARPGMPPFHKEPEGVVDIESNCFQCVSLKFVKMSSPENPSVDDSIQYSWYEIHTVIDGSFEGAKRTIFNNCSDKFFIMGRDFYYLADVLKEESFRYKV